MKTRAEVQAMLDSLAASWEGLQHERLVVRAWLLSAVAHDVIGHMPLDGILEVATLHSLGLTIDDLGDIHPEPVRIPIPVRKVEFGGSWVYACSWARYHSARKPIVRKKRKHFVESRFVQARIVDTTCGKFRSYDLATAAVVTPYVEWTLEASRAELRRLLPLLDSIGKDRNTGLGTVGVWEVDSTELDPLVVDGRPQRSLPCADGDLSRYAPGSCALGIRPVHPPYIWPGSRMQCAVPVEVAA